MPIITAVRAGLVRFRELFGKRYREQELSAEIESHVQMHVEDNLRAGMALEEARRQALLKLGGIEQTKEICRDQLGVIVGIVASVGRDTVHGGTPFCSEARRCADDRFRLTRINWGRHLGLLHSGAAGDAHRSERGAAL
jgi:hypothetical protein